MRESSAAVIGLKQLLELAPTALSVVGATGKRVVFANAAFRQLTNGDERALDRWMNSVTDLGAVLEEVKRTRRAVRDHPVAPFDGQPGASTAHPWRCTVWPTLNQRGKAQYLVIELRETSDADETASIQRNVAEQMLLSALKARDATDVANALRNSAAFLASEGGRMSDSLDEQVTISAISRMRLPGHPDAWTVVDTLDADGVPRRRRVVHPDPAKQILARELEGQWIPQSDDSFGIPAVVQGAESVVISEDVAGVLAGGEHDANLLRIIHALGIGPALTVALRVDDALIGAITFVDPGHAGGYTPEDSKLATDLASRAALAVKRARRHGEAVASKAKAELSNEEKSKFIGTLSHELRTPLSAIAGFVDLMDMGIHGPLTEAQHADLGRIRANQEHLLRLITDMLNLTKVGSGGMSYAIAAVNAAETAHASVALVAPLIDIKGLTCDVTACDPRIIARADPNRAIQILTNLLSNSIKFTPTGGRLTIECGEEDGAVFIRVSDTGIGVSETDLSVIFDPFIQVKNGLAGDQRGVGLGLSISRDLARAMGGDLTAESQLGHGSTFTLHLPKASVERAPADGS